MILWTSYMVSWFGLAWLSSAELSQACAISWRVGWWLDYVGPISSYVWQFSSCWPGWPDENLGSPPCGLSSSRRLAGSQSCGSLRVPSIASLLKLRVGVLLMSLLLHSHNQNKKQCQPRFKEWEIESVSWWEKLQRICSCL